MWATGIGGAPLIKRRKKVKLAKWVKIAPSHNYRVNYTLLHRLKVCDPIGYKLYTGVRECPCQAQMSAVIEKRKKNRYVGACQPKSN